MGGLAAATASEADPQIAKKIHTAQVMTVISWCTYPIVYLFPMFGFSAAKAVVSIQVGYCISDIFQMRSRLGHLPDLLRQVWQEGPLAMSMCMRWQAWLDFASFSSRTDTFNFYR